MIKNKFTDIEKLSFKRILVIQTAFIGDVILITPFLKGLRKEFPVSEIDVLAIPETSNVLQQNPNINRVFEFNKRSKVKRIPSLIKVIGELRKEQYDLAISIQSSFTSSMIMVLSNIPKRLGFHRQKMITHTITHIRGLHMRKRVLRLLETFSDNEYSADTELFWSMKEDKKVNKILGNTNGTVKVGIAPASAQYTKQWPKEYFAELIRLLEKNNIDVFLIGGPGERDYLDEISIGTKAINLAGNLSILESAALIKRLDVMVSNDSAPMHIADAVETKAIAFFGPTTKQLGFYPYREEDKILEVDLECRPCGKHGGDKCPLGHFKCMRDISPEYAFQQIMETLVIGKNNDK